MAKPDRDAPIRLDLNNAVFQDNLLNLQKPERHSALETLKKLRQITWTQLYGDNGLKWEKIAGIMLSPPSTRCASPSLVARRRIEMGTLSAS